MVFRPCHWLAEAWQPGRVEKAPTAYYTSSVSSTAAKISLPCGASIHATHECVRHPRATCEKCALAIFTDIGATNAKGRLGARVRVGKPTFPTGTLPRVGGALLGAGSLTSLVVLVMTRAAVLAFCLAGGLWAQYPPGTEWRRIRTNHFDIIFPSEIEADAERAANAQQASH